MTVHPREHYLTDTFAAPRWAFDLRGLALPSSSLLIRLVDHDHVEGDTKRRKGWVFPSQSTLAEMMNVSRDTISVSLRDLEDRSLITRDGYAKNGVRRVVINYGAGVGDSDKWVSERPTQTREQEQEKERNANSSRDRVNKQVEGAARRTTLKRDGPLVPNSESGVGHSDSRRKPTTRRQMTERLCAEPVGILALLESVDCDGMPMAEEIDKLIDAHGFEQARKAALLLAARHGRGADVENARKWLDKMAARSFSLTNNDWAQVRTLYRRATAADDRQATRAAALAQVKADEAAGIDPYAETPFPF